MNFGEALQALKSGSMVSREGWNGKGMFIFMRPADVLSSEVIDKIKSLPQSVKDWFAKNGSSTGESYGITFTAYLCMKAADGTIVNGWLASQTDMLSEDWGIVE